jgi:hypothetical protein
LRGSQSGDAGSRVGRGEFQEVLAFILQKINNNPEEKIIIYNTKS